MVKENCLIRMADDMRVSLSIIRNVDWVLFTGQTGENTLETGRMDYNMVEEPIHTLADLQRKVIGIEVSDLDGYINKKLIKDYSRDSKAR